jgi:hypothetical protein
MGGRSPLGTVQGPETLEYKGESLDSDRSEIGRF